MTPRKPVFETELGVADAVDLDCPWCGERMRVQEVVRLGPVWDRPWVQVKLVLACDNHPRPKKPTG